MVHFLGCELFSESLSIIDSRLAESLFARRNLRLGRNRRGAGRGFVQAQTPRSGAQLVQSNSMVLCYVTDRRLLNEPAPADALLQHIENAAAAGIDLIQIREKDLNARELLELTRHALASIHRTTAQNEGEQPKIIINDRIDVAVAGGAAGVHLSTASVPVAEAVNWVRAGNAPGNFYVGVSCHSVADAIAAERAHINYIFFGPVYETPSKASFGKPQGIDKLAEVCRSVTIPVLAIGGITEANASACVKAGASGVAAIRMFQRKKDISAVMDTVSRIRARA